MKRFPIGKRVTNFGPRPYRGRIPLTGHRKGLSMGNMKFDGADVTFELDGYDALVERARPRRSTARSTPPTFPRLYVVMDAELEGNEELAAAFAEAQEAAFGEAVLTVWAERIKSFKDSIPAAWRCSQGRRVPLRLLQGRHQHLQVRGRRLCANICDLYGAAPQIVDGFCEFLARNACLEFDGYAADMPVPCQLYVHGRGNLEDGLPAGHEQRPRVQARHGRVRRVRLRPSTTTSRPPTASST